MNRRLALLRLAGIAAGLPVALAACTDSKPAVAPASSKQQADETYRRLVEDARGRAAASTPFQGAPTQPRDPTTPTAADAFQVERWLYNLGFQQNLAFRIRQDLNLFALLVPEMRQLVRGGKLDLLYLARLDNTLFVKGVSEFLVKNVTTDELRAANAIIIGTTFRKFIVDLSSSFFEHDRFVAFLAKPLELSPWRQNALARVNDVLSLDATQYSVFRSIEPVLLNRFTTKVDPRKGGLIESASSNVAFYRSAWATQQMSDDELFELVQQASSPSVAKCITMTSVAFDHLVLEIARQMDASLPKTLDSPLRASLDAGI